MNNKGFILSSILILAIPLVILGLVGFIGYSLNKEKQEPNLGTGSNVNITGSLHPSRNDFWSLGTTSLKYQGVFSSITVNSCTGCTAGANADLQDAYNNSADDAQITLADAKDIILFLQDTATEPLFIISAEDQGGLRLNVGSTTNGVWEGFGRLGIGTTSPGTGLAVHATTTLLGLDTYIYGQLTLPHLVATSTTASSTLPQLTTTSLTATGLTVLGTLELEQAGTSTFAGGLSVGAGGLLSSSGLTLTGGHILSSGRLEITDTATSSILGTLALNLNGTGTSTITNLLASGNLFSDKSIVAGVASTTADSGTTTLAFSCNAANLQTAIMAKDVRVIFEDECRAGQILRMWIDVRPGGDGFQLDFDGLPDANGEYGSSTVLHSEATSTPFYMEGGKINRCQAEFMSIATTSAKANYAMVTCNLGFGW